MTTDYKPPSRRVSRELLGGWALKDVMAHRALQAGITEAELIHLLLQNRQCLMEQLHESISRTLPPIILAQPEPEGPTDEEIVDEARKYLVNEYALPAEITYFLDSDNFEYEPTIGCFRAVLTRWGRPAIQPMPTNNTQE